MKLVDTLDTLTLASGESWEHIPGKRIIPENEIDVAALKQIWEAQACKDWSIEGRVTPWDIASFGDCKNIDGEGFGRANLTYLWKTGKFDATNPIGGEDIILYWLWQSEKIQAYWSVGKTDLHAQQSNMAGYPVVLNWKTDPGNCVGL